MSDVILMRDALNELKQKTKTSRIVRDWKSMIPPDSRWFPGSKGNPSCKICCGTGWLRLELEDGPFPIGHKFFGKMFLCDCVQHVMKNIPTPGIQSTRRFEDPPEPAEIMDSSFDVDLA